MSADLGLPLVGWEQPAWLLLAAIPWLIWLGAAPNRRRARHLARFADPQLWPWLLHGDALGARRVPLHLCLGWTLAALAATGPYWLLRVPPIAGEPSADVVIVVDISPSMTVSDLHPDRLARAKVELQELMTRLEHDRIGVVAFSADAYKALPLTHDRDAVLGTLSALDPELVSNPGSNLTAALELAAAMLGQRRDTAAAVVLATDGGNHAPGALDAAHRLREYGIGLHVLGVGTRVGGPVLDQTGHVLRHGGEIVRARLERDDLKALADAGAGRYVEPGTPDRWETLSAELDRTSSERASDAALAETRRALYPWLLAASLIAFGWPFMPRIIRQGTGIRARVLGRAVTLGLLLLGLTVALPAAAWPWDEQRALHRFEQGDHAGAEILFARLGGYPGEMGLGAIAYREQRWAEALAHFEAAASAAADPPAHARALYNTGNALARLDRLEDARDAYIAALALWPNYPRAALNLSLVNQALAEATTPRLRDDTDVLDARDAAPGAAALNDSQGDTGGAQPRRQAVRSNGTDGSVAGANGDAGDTVAADPQVSDARAAMRGLIDDPAAVLRNRFAIQHHGRGLETNAKPW